MDRQRHDMLLSQVREWFVSLPEGVAELDIRTGSDEATYVEIRPLIQAGASPIHLRIDKESGFLSLGAGQGYSIDDTFWPDMPVVDVCQAIASGGLTEEVWLWKGEEAGRRGCLQVRGEKHPVCISWTRSLSKEMKRSLLGVLSGSEKRVVNYVPW